MREVVLMAPVWANHSPRNTSTSPQPSGGAPSIGNPKPSKTGHLESVWDQVKDRGLSEEAFKIIFMEKWHREILFICLVKVGFSGAVKRVPIPSQQYSSSY